MCEFRRVKHVLSRPAAFSRALIPFLAPFKLQMQVAHLVDAPREFPRQLDGFAEADGALGQPQSHARTEQCPKAVNGEARQQDPDEDKRNEEWREEPFLTATSAAPHLNHAYDAH